MIRVFCVFSLILIIKADELCSDDNKVGCSKQKADTHGKAKYQMGMPQF